MQTAPNCGNSHILPFMLRTLSILFGLVLFACLTLGGNIGAVAAVNVSGNIIADTTWTKANSPYLVTGGVFVAGGVTLTIEPGVEVRFAGNYSIEIDGTFIARGTAMAPISFGGPNDQYWGYIYFRDGSTDAEYDAAGNYVSGSIMQYCIVEYAGAAAIANNGVLRMLNAHPFIDHCTIRHNTAKGIKAWGLTGTLKIHNNTITNNLDSTDGGGIFLSQSSYPNPNPGGLSSIFNNTISYNETSGEGGGVFLEVFNAVNFTKNVVTHNKGQEGGGVFSRAMQTNITENLLVQNTAVNRGGGLGGLGQTVNNIFSDNQAAAGGAYHTISAGTSSIPANAVSLINNSFVRNAAANGAAWYLLYSSNIYNNLVAFNQATGGAPNQNIFLGAEYIIMNFNNFFGNTPTYEIFNNLDVSKQDIDAKYNWWGTAVQTEIEAMIYDFILDHTKGRVNFIPWDQAIRNDVPISPPQNLTVTRGMGGITLTWQANPEGNLAGYKIYWGEKSGYPYPNVRDVGQVTAYTIPLGDLPPGICFLAVTAYNSNYPITELSDPNYVADDPQTIINEKQTAGYESWFSLEKSYNTIQRGLPFLLPLLLDD
jgi:hypothetical protein